MFWAAGRATGRFYRPLALVVFLGPAIVLLLVGLVVPAIQTFELSFQNADSNRARRPGQLQLGVHHLRPSRTSWSPPRCGSWSRRSSPPLLGLSLALLVDRLRLQSLYKSLIFMPMAVSFVGASFIWRFVYEARDPSQPQVGLLSARSRSGSASTIRRTGS